MDTARARPEDLDELPLDRLRDLDLEAGSGPGKPAHVASASGVARRGRNIYVIGDESNHLARFDLTDGRPGTLHRALSGEIPSDPEERSKRRSELCFRDATPLGDGRVVFTASAEDEDGKIHGSVVGVLDYAGEVRRLRRIDRRWKVEGVHATTDTGVLDLLFVCDQDDPETPSPLLGASMPLEPGLE